MRENEAEKARAFLARGRIAVVGVSRNERDFSRVVFRELLRRGYDVVPVNPAMAQADGRTCHARVQDIRPQVAGALLMTPPQRTEQAVRDCVEGGVRSVWMHRGTGPGAASPEAMALCQASGLEVVADLCPFMVLPGVSWPHRLHRLFRRAAH
jgi:predicted CoA-binding protein